MRRLKRLWHDDRWNYGYSFAMAVMLSGLLIGDHNYVLGGVCVLLAVYWLRRSLEEMEKDDDRR